ncbi:aminomethyltransferase family protein [Blastococcus sp. TF02A-35]|uniref:aminomethyltransferase family protein n=1 Tax=Blastococcus sp. TF02A-35 TaxID=2559612 RepID=UPI00107406B3|nr:aminomethyltransferase family protein [Blastococcus sp. TF02A_35]TFV48469.1 aminomethyl transferase family protein [Blastococcus sp. TF02A_35]
MSSESLAAALARAGSPVELLRNLGFPPSTFPVRPEFTNWRAEQRSWTETCALLDQSHHMTDLFVSGPDALRLLSDVGVNTFAGFGVGRAKQFVAVDPGGHLIGDAILFHLEEELFDLVGHPMVLDWVTFHLERGGYRATAERDDNSAVRRSGPPRLYRYELQGPTAAALVEQVSGAPLPDVRFFGMAEFTIAGRRVRGLRHGMAGQPGFELFGPWEDGDAVLSALLEAGADHGLVRVGAKAYSTANLESGWVPAPLPALFSDHPLVQEYREWLPVARVGSVGGSMDSADIADYLLTPYEVGYGRTVRFDHEFIGREALERMAQAPSRTKVTLVWDADDVAAALGSLFRPGPGAKFMDLPKIRYATHHEDKVLRDGRQVGISLDCGYLANERAMVSLAVVEPEVAVPGTEVTVLWGERPVSAKPAVEEHRQVEIRATVAPVPFVDFARERYRGR